MLGPVDERTPPMTPQLALRVAIVGGCALVMFAIIFFRLWFLQVLSGSQYVRAAQVNVVRDIPIAAPRGEIVDRTGSPLVESEPVPAIQLSPQSLPAPVSYSLRNFVHQPAKDYRLVYGPLARLLRMSTKPGTCKFQVYLGNYKIEKFDVQLAPIPCFVAKGVVASQYANVTIRTDVSPDIQDYIAERVTQFPGVLSHDVYVRKYPLGGAGAQVFGELGPLTALEQGTKAFHGIEQGNTVGQTGLEYQYNQYLQGINGKERVKVNSLNQFEGYGRETVPIQGDTLKLSLDAQLEKVGQQALAQTIAKNPRAAGGAFVALNPETGSVYAMGSAPTYDPSIFDGSHPISDKTWASLTNTASNYPLLNRAIQSVGPDGSTFKVITATAALESGVWSLNDTYYDNGRFCFANTSTSQCRQNSGGVSYGAVDLETAIEKSVDTFFYNLGDKLDYAPIEVYNHPTGGALQQWAAKFGIGHSTGIDLAGAASGSMASPKYFQDMYKLQLACEHRIGQYKNRPKSSPCQIADTPYWTVGDNVNAAVGQGDVQVSPLQLAIVYSAIANGGTIVTPHLGMQIDSLNGTIVQNVNPGPKRHLHIQPGYLAAVRQGLRQAVQAGTSADTMGSFPQQVYGKTGTAQYFNAQNVESDYAWYACFVPATATSKPITVVVWVPKGGFGDVAAAPVARQILNQWFYGKPGKFIEGTSTTL